MNQTSVEVYKRLICDLIMDMTNEKFVRQIYSIVWRKYKREA